jgi:hypothetical protein
MDNVFNKAAGAAGNRKLGTGSKVARFSPSYGVRRGFIKDPNWPPAQFPDEGNAANRRFRRMPATFQVKVGDAVEALTVSGNISSGGAMFVMSSVLGSDQVQVSYNGATANAAVIASESKGGQFMYRAHFLDENEAASVWMALVKAMN